MKLNIGTKLIAGFSVGLLALLIVSAVTFTSVTKMNDNAFWVDHTHEVLAELEEVVSLLKDAETGQRGYLITGEDRYQEPYVLALPEISMAIDEVQELTSDNPVQQQRIAQLRPLVQAKLDELQETIDLRTNEGFEAALAVVLTDAGKQVMDDIRGVISEMDAEERSLLVVRAASSDSAARSAKTAIIVGSIIAFIVVGAIAFYLIRNITGGLKTVVSVATDMSENTLPALVSNMERAAAGDLTTEFTVDLAHIDDKQSDEIGEIKRSFNRIQDAIGAAGNSYNTMVREISGLVGNVRGMSTDLSGASSQLASASNQAGDATQGLADASQQVASGAQEQSSSIQKASGVVEDLIQSVGQISDGSLKQTAEVDRAQGVVSQVANASKQVAENAQGATEGAQTANKAAENGVEVVQKTISGMSSINEAVQNVTTEVSNLGERSQEIGKIVSVIDDIAAQTNLLALNAAIEAARAGEQGRGFAVVADEVRQLAERVSQATSEIASLIESVQESVSTSVQATEAGTKQVEEGTTLASGAGEALDQIIQAVGSVTRQVEEISTLAEEVSSSSSEMVEAIDGISSVATENSEIADKMKDASGEVKSAMETVSAVTEQTSAAAEETSASTEEMSAQVEEVVASSQSLAEMAESLQGSVEVFRVGNYEGTAPTSITQEKEISPETGSEQAIVDEEQAA